ncbi:hypothetical protein ACFPA1_25130 [Neobacillus sp. GCM10023253]|uniref:hypothetical protein n=1 Tax=Neobacillus sp. GCM10023253 TaxID=3252644 RepID=UPI003622959B
MYQSEPILNKKETLTIIAQLLMEKPKTSINSLREAVKNILRVRGAIGPFSETKGGGTYHYTMRISDKDILLVNECIYDLLYTRVITPGIDEANLELPWIHVSDEEKLKSFL